MTDHAEVRRDALRRTDEQMEWIRDRFKPDGLLRLAHSTQDYYDQKGYYLPDVAALAFVTACERDALLAELEQAKRDNERLATNIAVVFDKWKQTERERDRAVVRVAKLDAALRNCQNTGDEYVYRIATEALAVEPSQVAQIWEEQRHPFDASEFKSLHEQLEREMDARGSAEINLSDAEARLASVPALVEALRRITPKDEPLDIDQDCKFCRGHFHEHYDGCEWVAARAALVVYEQSQGNT